MIGFCGSDTPASHGGDYITGSHASLLSRAVLCHFRYQHPLSLWDIKVLDELWVKILDKQTKPGDMYLAVLDEIIHDPLGPVDRDSKTNTLRR